MDAKKQKNQERQKLIAETQKLIPEIEKRSFTLWVRQTLKTLVKQGIQHPTHQQVADTMSRMNDTVHNPVRINQDAVKNTRNDVLHNVKDSESLDEEILLLRNRLVTLWNAYTCKRIEKRFQNQAEWILDDLKASSSEFLLKAANEIGRWRDGRGRNGEMKPDKIKGGYHFRFNPGRKIWWDWAWEYFIKTGCDKELSNLVSPPLAATGNTSRQKRLHKEIKKTRERLEQKLLCQPTWEDVWQEYHQQHPERSKEDFDAAIDREYIKLVSTNTPVLKDESNLILEDTLKAEDRGIVEEIYARFSEQDILAVAAAIFDDPFEYQLVEHRILNPDNPATLKEIAEQKGVRGEALSLLLNDRLETLYCCIRDWPFLSLDTGSPSGKCRNQAEKQLKELNRTYQAELETTLGPLTDLFIYVKEKRSKPPPEDIAIDLNVLLLRIFDKELGEEVYKQADMRALSKTLRDSESLNAVFYLGKGNFREEGLSEHKAIQALLNGYLNWLLWRFGGYQKQVEYQITRELGQLLPTNDRFILHYSSNESVQLAESYLQDWRMKSSKDRGKRLRIFDALKKKGSFEKLDSGQLSLFIPNELHDLWNKKMKGQRSKDLTIKGNSFKSVNSEGNARQQAAIANYITWQFFLGTCVSLSETDGKNIALKTLQKESP